MQIKVAIQSFFIKASLDAGFVSENARNSHTDSTLEHGFGATLVGKNDFQAAVSRRCAPIPG
jgi:hypothetical protein